MSASRRRLAKTGLLLLVVTALFFVRVLLGDFTVTFGDFFTIVTGGHVDVPGANYIVMQSKLPRACAALLAGAVFGASGASMQSLVRNPLASPDVLGLSLGASAAAVFTSVVWGWSGTPMMLAAICGGLAAAGVILSLAKGQTTRMILVGIALAAAMQSVIQWVLLKAAAYQAQDAMVWLAGDVGSTSWSEIRQLAAVGIPVIALLCALAHRLRVLELGRPLAIGLGVPDGAVRFWTFAAVVVGVAVATGACGPIAFIALLSGPIARRIMGRTSIFQAALIGGGIAIAGDYIGNYLIPGGSKLPVGVVTGLAGAPVLAWLLLRQTKGAR